jgi:hypothetical protein
MKTMQWAGAILVLAAVVFGITFVMNFLGSDNAAQDPGKGKVVHKLSFATRVMPPQSEPALQSEMGQAGYQDFWFKNAEGQDVPVGLMGKSCTCTEVEIFMPPQAFPGQLPAQSATLLGLVTAGRNTLSWPEEAAAGAAWNEAMLKQEQAAEKTSLGNNNSVTVPAGAVGWVRMKWVTDKADTRQLRVGLWMEQEGVGLTELITGVRIAEPMMSDGKVSLGTLQDRDLPRSTTLRCWSLTRPSFRLEAKVVREKGSAAGDPFVVGTPEPMPEADCRKLVDELKVRQVRSGYRVPVTLKPKSSDGSTASDLGHFSRVVELSSPDEGISPLRVQVEGVVLGDVIVGRGQRGVVEFGSFWGSRGRHEKILLETDVPDLKLQLDEKRIPGFVKAQLGEPETAPSGHRSWTLEVTVLPHRVRGSFPRQDDPEYRDSAVYVKTTGSQARTIRIPLMGTANEG